MSPDETARQNKINPAIHKFVDAMDKEGLQVSALIFDPEGDFLIRAGNVEHQGEAFVKLHYMLSLVAAHLDAAGYYKHVEPSSPQQASLPRDTQAIADRLAVLLMSMPPTLLPDRVLDLVNEYAEARKET